MKVIKTIAIQQFCDLYNVPITFVESLNNYDLINIKIIDNSKHIETEQINNIERLIRLHYHLNINFEGLDVVVNLLNQIDNLQTEINELNNKLEFYIK